MAVSGRLLANFSKSVFLNLRREPYKFCNNFSKLRKFSTTPSFSSGKKFSEKHEWVEISGKIGTVGISNYAQEALGDVVYAQLPDIGAVLTQNDECGALESVKAASEVYTPISGKVIEKNTEIEETPALVNQSCYDKGKITVETLLSVICSVILPYKGWLFKLEISNEKEMENLMTEEQYNEFLKKSAN